jgi:SAM-dependent methyltransferase
MGTRWEKWFTDDNLARDPRILAAPPSRSAERAARAFLARDKRRILDLACGVGRDTFYLEGRGLQVVGADASVNGVRVAQRAKRERGAEAAFLAADARRLPFRAGSFEGVYCFGLLHEFTGRSWKEEVEGVMAEIRRLLCAGGILVITVLADKSAAGSSAADSSAADSSAAGEPQAGLPAVQLYTRPMFAEAARGLRAIEVERYEDVGCTGRADYEVWYGVFQRVFCQKPRF